VAEALKDPDQYVKLEAVKALGNIGDASFSKEIAGLLAPEEQPQLRIETALALAKMEKSDGLLTAYEFTKAADLSLKSQAGARLFWAGKSRYPARMGFLYPSFL
jgi:HEAT repeat protein